jgi:Putative metal-binding motif
MHVHRQRSPRRRRRAALLVALALAAPVACAVAACSDLPDVELSAACTVNSDCAPPLVCAFQVCHQQCTQTRDCPAPERCVKGDGTSNVCQAIACSYNSQCPAPEVCAVDGQCRDQCATARDCVSGQDCVGGVCADRSELTDAGTLRSSADGGVGTPCQINSDCGDAGLVCRGGACQVQCRADIDCVPPQGPGGVCVAGICGVPPVLDAGSDAPSDAPPGYGMSCDLPSDCPGALVCGLHGACVYACDADEDCAATPGACCAAHACTPCAPPDAGSDAGPDGGDGGDGGTSGCKPCGDNADCDDGLYCDGQEQCAGGCCQPALDTPCDSHSACIQDGCDEATRACSHTVLAATDADGDGHLAVACGGDDCDDGDPTVYAGHPEVYDGKDNDCNGFVDDWVAEPKGLTSPPLVTAPLDACQFAVPVGGGPGGWLCTYFDVGSDTAYFMPYDTSWNPGTASTVDLSGGVTDVLAVASETETAAILFGAAGTELRLVLVHADGSLIGAPVLDAALPVATNGSFNVAWTGQGYVAGWWGSGGVGYFAQVDTLANVTTQALPTTVDPTSPVAVAGSGTALGVAYTDEASGDMLLQVYDTDGALGGTAHLGTGSVYAMTSLPGAFVVLGADMGGDVVVMYVPVQGAMPGSGPTHVFPAGTGAAVVKAALGASDGVGAAFLMQYSPTGVWFGYLNGNLKNPFELSEVAAGATLADVAGGPGGRLGVFYTLGGHFFGRQAGYASLSQADCAADVDCAGGVCLPQVATGPEAYSICQ